MAGVAGVEYGQSQDDVISRNANRTAPIYA